MPNCTEGRERLMVNGDHHPLGQVYSLDEAAALLRQPPRTIAKIARRHGLCSRFGRDILLSESDLLAIWDVQRCPSSSSNAEKPGTSAAPSEEQVSMRLA